MTDCIFCKIVNGEIPSDKVYEDDKVIAFMDIRPVSRGHTLVVPKIHAADIVETPDEVIADVIKQAKRIAVSIQHALKADGFTISTNRGEAAGQTVFHLHFHIIPRYHQEPEPLSRSQLVEEIKKHL